MSTEIRGKLKTMTEENGERGINQAPWAAEMCKGSALNTLKPSARPTPTKEASWLKPRKSGEFGAVEEEVDAAPTPPDAEDPCPPATEVVPATVAREGSLVKSIVNHHRVLE